MRKRALGRGLDALIPKPEKEVFQEGYRMIPLADVKPNPFQPRAKIRPADVTELVASIKEKGIIQPLIVRREGSKFVIAAGERRLKAAEIAGLKEVPVVIRDLSDRELLEIGLIENLHRKDLNPIEEALAYDALSKQFNLTHEDISLLVSKDRSTITNYLRLLSLPDQVRRLIQEGKIDMGHARAILSLENETQITHAAERVVQEQLSVRATEALVRKMQKKPRIVPGKEKAANILILEDELSKLLHTKVTVNWKKKQGSIIIHCYSLEDFDRVYDILKQSRKA